MKTLIVGDIHGDWGKLNSLLTVKRPDIVLQCGDFGWWPQMEVKIPVLYGNQKKWTLRGVKLSGALLYFCDGNHENHPDLKQDGYIHEMYDGVNFCSRGSVLPLPDGRNVLFAGGASSVDKNMRTPGHDWFPEETIKAVDLDRIIAGQHRIDIVVSHTCPTAFLKHLHKGNLAKVNDPSCKALDVVLDKLKPKQWFFGHWHLQKEGYDNGCHWQCLDYPRHSGMWWTWLR